MGFCGVKATLAANLMLRYFLRICNGGCDISLRMPLIGLVRKVPTVILSALLCMISSSFNMLSLVEM